MGDFFDVVQPASQLKSIRSSFKHWGVENGGQSSLSSSMRAIRSSNHSWLTNGNSVASPAVQPTALFSASSTIQQQQQQKKNVTSGGKQKKKKGLQIVRKTVVLESGGDKNKIGNGKIGNGKIGSNNFIINNNEVIENFGSSDVERNRVAFESWLAAKKQQDLSGKRQSSKASSTHHMKKQVVTVVTASTITTNEESSSAFSAWLESKKKQLTNHPTTESTTEREVKQKKAKAKAKAVVEAALSQWIQKKRAQQQQLDQRTRAEQQALEKRKCERTVKSQGEYDRWVERKQKEGWIKVVIDATHPKPWTQPNNNNGSDGDAEDDRDRREVGGGGGRNQGKVKNQTPHSPNYFDCESNVVNVAAAAAADDDDADDDVTTNDSFELQHQQHHALIKMLRCPLKPSKGSSPTAATKIGSKGSQEMMNPVFLANRHPSLLTVATSVVGGQKRKSSAAAAANHPIIPDPIVRSRRSSIQIQQQNSNNRRSSSSNAMATPVYPPSLWISRQRLTTDFSDYCKRYPYLVPDGGSEYA